MNDNEELELELSQHLNIALPHRRKLVENSIEYQLAIKEGNVKDALDIAWGILYGKGRTKAERTRSGKQIKIEDRWSHYAPNTPPPAFPAKTSRTINKSTDQPTLL